MSLTGLPLQILLVVLTVVLFAATVRLWPRLARRGVRPLAGRTGLVLLVQLSLLCTVAAAANTYFAFYTDWGQLLGVGGSGQASYHAAGGPATRLVRLERRMSIGVPGGSDLAKAGEVEQVSITGERTGLADEAYVYLPPQYFQARYRHSDFPAVLVSTGYPGNVTALVTRLKYPVRMTTGIDTGADRPMVLVMMSPMVVRGRDTECTDVPGGPQAATYWEQDVPQAVDAAYRVMPGDRSWGLMGDSTGGYCAVKLAMRDPQRFGAAVSLSGYYGALKDWTTGDLYGSSPSFREENDLLWRLRHLPAPPVSLLLATSRSGEQDSYPGMLAFLRLAHAPLRVTTLIRAQGGHNFATWASEIPASLHWLGDRLPAAVPDA